MAYTGDVQPPAHNLPLHRTRLCSLASTSTWVLATQLSSHTDLHTEQAHAMWHSQSAPKSTNQAYQARAFLPGGLFYGTQCTLASTRGHSLTLLQQRTMCCPTYPGVCNYQGSVPQAGRPSGRCRVLLVVPVHRAHHNVTACQPHLCTTA